MQIDDIDDARAIEVRESNATLIELIGSVEPRRIVHCHLGAKTAVTKVGPVADFAIPNAHEIGESVTGHICEIDRLCSICKDQGRTEFLIMRVANTLCRSKPFFT